MDTVLERLIDEKGFRKGFIAREAGLHPSQLSRLLHSERDPKLDAGAAAVIAERLGVPAEVFLDGERLRMSTRNAPEHQNAPAQAAAQAPARQATETDTPATPEPGRSETAPAARGAA